MAKKTLAERFVVDPEAMIYEAPYFGVSMNSGNDDVSENRLADGSIIRCDVKDGIWIAASAQPE